MNLEQVKKFRKWRKTVGTAHKNFKISTDWERERK